MIAYHPLSPKYSLAGFQGSDQPSLFRTCMAKLTRFANEDTPETVEVPGTLSGLGLWSVTKLGAMGMLCTVVGFMFTKLEDQHKEKEAIYKERIVEQQRVIEAMEVMVKTMDQALKLPK